MEPEMWLQAEQKIKAARKAVDVVADNRRVNRRHADALRRETETAFDAMAAAAMYWRAEYHEMVRRQRLSFWQRFKGWLFS